MCLILVIFFQIFDLFLNQFLTQNAVEPVLTRSNLDNIQIFLAKLRINLVWVVHCFFTCYYIHYYFHINLAFNFWIFDFLHLTDNCFMDKNCCCNFFVNNFNTLPIADITRIGLVDLNYKAFVVNTPYHNFHIVNFVVFHTIVNMD